MKAPRPEQDLELSLGDQGGTRRRSRWLSTAFGALKSVSWASPLKSWALRSLVPRHPGSGLTWESSPRAWSALRLPHGGQGNCTPLSSCCGLAVPVGLSHPAPPPPAPPWRRDSASRNPLVSLTDSLLPSPSPYRNVNREVLVKQIKGAWWRKLFNANLIINV